MERPLAFIQATICGNRSWEELDSALALVMYHCGMPTTTTLPRLVTSDHSVDGQSLISSNLKEIPPYAGQESISLSIEKNSTLEITN